MVDFGEPIEADEEDDATLEDEGELDLVYNNVAGYIFIYTLIEGNEEDDATLEDEESTGLGKLASLCI